MDVCNKYQKQQHATAAAAAAAADAATDKLGAGQ
jgi:hypothetical protein